MRKVVSRQEEYVRIKMVCNDMNVYYQRYQHTEEAWYNKYLGENVDKTVYLKSNFECTTEYTEAHYIIIFNDTYDLITIKTKDDDKVLINNLQLPLGEE